jgi:hypothetical protein
LIDDHDPVGVAGRHVVALIYLPYTDAAGDRRYDAGIRQIHLSRLDLAFIRFYRSHVLVHEGTLGIELLHRDGVLLDQPFVALEIQSRVCQQRLIATQIALHGLQCRLIGARIYLGNDIALVNELPLREEDFLQGSADLSAHRHVGQGRDRAECGDADLDITGRHRRHGHGHRSVLSAASTAGAVGSRLRAVLDEPHDAHEQH